MTSKRTVIEVLFLCPKCDLLIQVRLYIRIFDQDYYNYCVAVICFNIYKFDQDYNYNFLR